MIGATAINDGIAAGAFTFDGNARIDVGNLDFSGGEYTVSLWIRTTTPAVTEEWRIAMAKMNIFVGDMTFELFLGDGRPEAGGDSPVYAVWDDSVTVVNIPPPDVPAPALNARDGDWHMVTASYTAGSQQLYFDGCLVVTQNYPGPLPLVAEGVMIGGFDGFGPFHHPWIGDIDEVSIYTRVLDATEVLELFELHRPGHTCPGPVTCAGLPATIVGTAGPDILVGTPGPDVIHGLGDNDGIDGRGGDDVICGGPGDDILLGSEGDDRLFGGSGNDLLSGGAGDDILRGGTGNDRLLGGEGHDRLLGGVGDDRLSGGAGDDLLFGGVGQDVLSGGGGFDVCDGQDDMDTDSGGCEIVLNIP
jgi:Ca2+-binding RTX toxin-like protein